MHGRRRGGEARQTLAPLNFEKKKLEKNNTCQILIPKIKIILKYGFIYASI
jgi:hypothetical protein